MMTTFSFYTNVLSPHTAPLILEIIKLAGNCDYVYQQHGGERFRTSHVLESLGGNAICEEDDPAEARRRLRQSDVLITGVRDLDLMEERVKAGKLTIYQSERWLKPENLLAVGHSEYSRRGIWIPGILKLVFPFALKRARRIVRLFNSEHFCYLPIGVRAAEDMVRVCGIMNSDFSYIFRQPRLDYEKVPCGRIRDGGIARNNVLGKYISKMRLWGYFVAPSDCGYERAISCTKKKKVLWVGRMSGLKRLDTLIKAVGNLENFSLDIYGDGPDIKYVRRIADSFPNVSVFKPVEINIVRHLMRDHDIYVLSSNSFEGWGAVVNEALEEGMSIIGTYEAGASATMLPSENLFHSGDWQGLRALLLGPIKKVDIGMWTARNAAKSLMELIEEGFNVR